jgi:hypothetical protein
MIPRPPLPTAPAPATHSERGELSFSDEAVRCWPNPVTHADRDQRARGGLRRPVLHGTGVPPGDPRFGGAEPYGRARRGASARAVPWRAASCRLRAGGTRGEHLEREVGGDPGAVPDVERIGVGEDHRHQGRRRADHHLARPAHELVLLVDADHRSHAPGLELGHQLQQCLRRLRGCGGGAVAQPAVAAQYVASYLQPTGGVRRVDHEHPAGPDGRRARWWRQADPATGRRGTRSTRPAAAPAPRRFQRSCFRTPVLADPPR